MIHELLITANDKPDSIKKKGRKLAMTGGYEVALKEDLCDSEIEAIFNSFVVELDSYPRSSNAYQASIAYRIIKLCKEHKNCPDTLKHKIESVL